MPGAGLELPGSRRHLILGEAQRWEARMGRPGKYPAGFRREAFALVKSSGSTSVSVELAELFDRPLLVRVLRAEIGLTEERT